MLINNVQTYISNNTQPLLDIYMYKLAIITLYLWYAFVLRLHLVV